MNVERAKGHVWVVFARAFEGGTGLGVAGIIAAAAFGDRRFVLHAATPATAPLLNYPLQIVKPNRAP